MVHFSILGTVRSLFLVHRCRSSGQLLENDVNEVDGKVVKKVPSGKNLC